jgi:hypothetical protein
VLDGDARHLPHRRRRADLATAWARSDVGLLGATGAATSARTSIRTSPACSARSSLATRSRALVTSTADSIREQAQRASEYEALVRELRTELPRSAV